MNTQLELLSWSPPVQIIAFPLEKQVGRIREVASKIAAKSDKQVDHYVRQVTGGMFARLSRIGIPADQQEEMVGAFMSAVDDEISRHLNRHNGGAA